MKYYVKFQNPEDPFDNGLVRNREFETREDAQKYCDEKAAFWQGIYTFSVYTPYTPPAITHEGALETNAGSPLPCIFDDESGLCK